MKALVLLAFTATAFAATDKTVDRNLNTSSSPNVSVNTGSGSIKLHPGSDAQVHIVAHIRANNNGWFSSSAGDIESRINQIAANPPIQQAGNDITIGERNRNDLYKNIIIDYDITLPRAAAITAGTGSGDVDIQDVGASLKASSGSGNVKAHGIRGTANLNTGSGDIELQETATGDVRAQTGSGNIHLEGVSGGLHAGTGSGNITIAGTPTTDWKLETGSGNIHMDLGRSAHFTLNATTGSGSIHTDQPLTLVGTLDKHHITGTVNGGGPTLRAGTGSGDIEIR